MDVDVRLHGALRDRFPDGRATVTLEEGATVRALLDRLGLPNPFACVCVVNGSPGGQATPLRHGDSVQVYPPVAGG